MKWKRKAGSGKRRAESARKFFSWINALRSPLSALRILVVAFAVGLTSCAYYSFTGAAIPEHLSTIAIPLAEDNTTSPLVTMNEELTRRLTERFVGQTRLRLEPSEDEADVVLFATLDRYTNQPTSVGADEQAELNRVTVTVNVTYTDRVQNEEILRRSFSRYADYDPLAAGLSGEVEAAQLALDNIADDIFTAATSNW